MEKSWDLESQIAKVEENLVLILESINKDKEEVIPEGKRLDLEARLDFVEKLVRKIKAVGFNITDENQNQYSSFNKLISKKLGKLRIECAADQEEKEDQIKVMKEQFEEFTLKFEKQIEDQQKVNEELKKQLGEFEKNKRNWINIWQLVVGRLPQQNWEIFGMYPQRGLAHHTWEISGLKEISRLKVDNPVLTEDYNNVSGQESKLKYLKYKDVDD
ncbi:hypothetical protein COLO4_27005 [Corchorus olitorius]|uniref:Uncharacterized protein n=1 Tax=Corchorus olitorius TaxID=93759 RepID=A0A1R3HTF7_9ROSI|nr:hypothetical protein COLO4_27005 [Corchorus olitorius]